MGNGDFSFSVAPFCCSLNSFNVLKENDSNSHSVLMCYRYFLVVDFDGKKYVPILNLQIHKEESVLDSQWCEQKEHLKHTNN